MKKNQPTHCCLVIKFSTNLRHKCAQNYAKKYTKISLKDDNRKSNKQVCL